MKLSTSHISYFCHVPLLALLFILAVALPALAAPAVKAQRTFATAEEAVSALVDATKSGYPAT